MTSSKITDFLLSKFEGDLERVGFILKNGEGVEVLNVCDKPQAGFEVMGVDILRFEEEAVATWHTHPNAPSNLSTDDFHTFLNWPEWEHYIIGTDGISKYVVQDGEVLDAS